MPSTEPLPLPSAQLDSASQPFLRELGRLVIASSRLDQIDAAVASLHRPRKGSALATELDAWRSGAALLHEACVRVFAAAASGHFSGSSSDCIRVQTPDGTTVAADTEYLERMLQRIHRHDVSGHLLHLKLDVPAEAAVTADPVSLRPDQPAAASDQSQAAG